MKKKKENNIVSLKENESNILIEIPNNYPYEFILQHFKVIKFSLIEPNKNIMDSFSPENLDNRINVELFEHPNGINKRIAITIMISYNLPDGKKELLNSSILTEFQMLRPNIFDREFLTTFVSIAYSTCRGILFEKTRGHLLNRVILPIVDPAILSSHLEIKSN